MRTLHKALLASAGAILIGGAAVAAGEEAQVLEIALPDGAVAQIQHVGDGAPRVMVSDVPAGAAASPADRVFLMFGGSPLDAAVPVPMSRAEPFFGFDMPLFAGPGPSAFADIDRVMAAMDARMDAMMRQLATVQARMASDPAATARMVSEGGTSPGGAPAGVVQYSFVSTTSRDGCTTSVQWSSDGSGAQPRMVRTSAGNCAEGTDSGGGAPVKAAASPAPKVDEPIPGAKRT